jgi:hypothetical protein
MARIAKALVDVGLSPSRLQIDAYSDLIVMDFANGSAAAVDDIDTILDRRIAEQEKNARPGGATHGAGAIRKRCKTTKDEPS